MKRARGTTEEPSVKGSLKVPTRASVKGFYEDSYKSSS